jgi:hypothetical protein
MGSKTTVYRDVQAAGETVKRLRQAQVTGKVQVVGADTPFVTCNREQVMQVISADVFTHKVLEIELVDSESIEALHPFIQDWCGCLRSR